MAGTINNTDKRPAEVAGRYSCRRAGPGGMYKGSRAEKTAVVAISANIANSYPTTHQA